MIAVLVLLAAMGCLALSIYKVKEWYRKNTRTADPDACEQEKVNLKMMERRDSGSKSSSLNRRRTDIRKSRLLSEDMD